MLPPSTHISSADDGVVIIDEASTRITSFIHEQFPSFLQSEHKPTPISTIEPIVINDQPIIEKNKLDTTREEDGKVDNNNTPTTASSSSSIRSAAAIWKENLIKTCSLRKEHHHRLMDYLDSKSNSDSASLLLITGQSGAGKTRLVNSIRGTIEKRGGFFITGKFNQTQQLEPYTAFISACTEFVTMVVKRGDKVVDKIRETILQAIGDDNKYVLTGMIPALEHILGNKVEGMDHRSRFGDSAPRFVFVFRKFLRAISMTKRPIVLLLDDLHWADPCSLDLLVNVVMDLLNNTGLVVIGTCDSHVTADNYLSQKLREMEDVAHLSIINMSLPNLIAPEVQKCLSVILQRNLDECRWLANVVKSQTNGRPFFISEFLRWLEESGLLYRDHTTSAWTWDENHINLAVDTIQPERFLFDRLGRLPASVKEVLKIASCLGMRIEKKIIEYVLGCTVDTTSTEGFLNYDEVNGVLFFTHDELQKASYQLILEDDRERFHLDIGRRIWRALDKDEVDRYIFVILAQIALARRILTRESERLSAAFLCLEAGKKAAKASTFRIAAFYLSLGIELVGDRGWREEYQLTMALYDAGAEMELILANYERVEALLRVVFNFARTDTDKIQSYVTQMSMLANRGRHNESLDLGIDVLQKLGEHFPKRMCNARLLTEVRSVKLLLKGKSDEQILRMPMIEDGVKLSCFKILNHMFFSAMWTRPIFYWFIALKSVKLTMNYGLSNFSASAFPIYGIMCISAFHDINEGYRFGELGLKLLDKFGCMEHLPRVFAAHYGVIHSWKRPMREALAPLWRAAQVGAQTGDIEFSSFCASAYMKLSSSTSRNLDEWLNTFDDIQRTVISRRQEMFVTMATFHVQAAHQFIGFAAHSSPSADKQWAYNQLFFHGSRMRISYIFNDFDVASESASHVTAFWSVPPTVGVTDMVFFSGLVAAADARLGRNRRRNIAVAKQRLQLLRKWSLAAPCNYAHKKWLVEAELASARKKDAEAMECYTCAIALATQYDFSLEVALANERAAQHLLRNNSQETAESYFTQACAYYDKWGGKAKLAILQKTVAGIYGSPSNGIQ